MSQINGDTSDGYHTFNLAKISSKTRVRLNSRGIALDPPSEHAERLVRFFQRVMAEPYLASPEHSERVVNEFIQQEASLREVTS